jgi:hypothetical protein
MTTNSTNNLSDRDLFAAYDRARRRLTPFQDPKERLRVWQEIQALSGELERRYPPATEPLRWAFQTSTTCSPKTVL